MTIVLKTVSDSKAAQDDLAKLRKSVEGIKQSADGVSASISNFTKSIGAGLAAYGTFRVFTNYSDELTNLESKLRLVTDSQKELTQSFKEIQRIAVGTRASISDVSNLYTRMALSAKRFGASQQDIFKFTEAVSKSIATSGASLQESQAAVQQLGQALASGRLQGDELRSILENAPPLAMAIADGLGVSIGKMRKLGEEGELTSAKVFKALLSQQDKVNANFDKMGITYAGAFTNLNNALVILFSKVREEFSSSSSSLAKGINDFAIGIVNFANNFKLNMAIARSSIVGFVLDGVILFTELSDAFTKFSEDIVASAEETYKVWKPTLVKLSNDLLVWGTSAAAVSASVAKSLYDSFASTDFGKRVIAGLNTAFDMLASKVLNIFENLKANMPVIDVKAVFPGLDVALNYLKSWAIKAERWFFWLYDEVIGHSWIPDLVEGVGNWLKKLAGSPLASVLDFAKKVNASFGGLNIATVFTGAIAAVGKFRSALLPILGIVTAIGAGIVGLNYLNKIKASGTGVSDTQATGITSENSFTSRWITAAENIVKWLKLTFSQMQQNFSSSTLVRTVKQVLGIQDTTPGKVFGTVIDTNAKVGRGTFRNSEDRPLGHDIINALPSDWQIPFIATFTGIFAIAIVKAFEAGTTRSVLLSVLTTAAGLVVAQNVQDKEIRKSFSGAAFTFLEIIEKGITKLFAGNVIQDPLGFLSIITKTALLFEKGRAILGQAAIAIAKSPTTFVNTLFTAAEAKMTNSKMEALNKEIASLPKNLNETFKLNNKTYQENIRDLAKMRDASGGVIGEQRARAAAAGTSVTALGTNATLKLAEAMRNFTAVNASQSQLAESKAIKADLIKTRDDLQSKSEELSKQVKEAKTAFQQGIKNFAAGGLGLIGGVAGFQIGVEVAKGITGEENGWKRVGTVIGFSMGGQAIGSAIGLVLAQILITAGGAIGGMIATGFLALNPIVRGVAIFTAAIFAGYELFKDLPTEWKAALKEGLGVNKPVVPGTNIDKTDVGIAAGATAIGTWVAVRLGMLRPLFDATRNTIASNLAGLSMMWSVVMSSFSSFVTTLRTSLASSGPGLATSLTAGLTIAIGAIAALFSAPAVIVALKAALIASLIAGITYMGVKLKESIFGSDTKVETPNAAVQAIPTRANGGWITGPGTGTSDSIPAMLSNGEFVVNAKSAKDNWQLLTAINNGSISKFANGGSVGVAHYQSGGAASASNKPVAVVVQNPEDIAPKGAWDKFLNIVEEKYKDVQSKFSKALAPLDPLKNGTVSTNMPTFSSSDTKGLIQQMEGLKTIEKSMGLMQTKLASAGFESISIDGLTALNASTISSVASALDKIEERQKQMAKLGAGSFGAKMASEDIGRLTSEIADALKFSGTGFTKSSKFIEEKKEKKPTDITLEDQLNILNKAFPKLELSVEDFRVLPDKLRESIFGMGLQIERATTNINKEIIGKLEYGGTITQEIQDKFKKIEEDRKNYQGIVLKSIESIRTPFANMKGTFQSLGVNITEEAYNGLSDVQRELLLQLIEGAEEATKLLKQPQTAVPQDIRTAAQETVSRNIAIINETIADGAKVAMDKFGRLKFDLNKVNVSIDEFTYNMMSDLERQTLDAYRDAMIAATNKLKNEPNMPEGERQTLQKFVNDSSESLDKTFSKRRPGYKNPGQMAGDAFASSIGDGFSSAVTAAFKGQADEGKSVLETMMGSMFTTLTNTIIDTFVKGMLNPLIGEDSPMMKELKSFGESLFTSFTGVFSGGGESGKGIFDSISSFFKEIDWSSMIGMMGFATGGYVSGAGTSTSDSIPAMLSNGEFVINADATRKNFKLLNAINSGKIGKFADGGLVSSISDLPRIDNSPAKSNVVNNTDKSNQVININITGDISKQTRKEILMMSPEIASMVQNNFRERRVL